MKKIAIIGAGVSGLTLAYRFLKNGYNVTLYDAGKDVGGQLYAFPVQGVATELYYHHTFMSDTNFIGLCEELKIDDKLEWLDSSMAYYTDSFQYAFGTPFDLIKFKPLNFINKIKFVISILKLQNIKDIKFVEKYSAKEWFVNNGYEKVWDIIWEPLFKLKFAELSDDISLVWLWDKLIKRGKSRGGSKEKLCYMKGSFFELAKALKKEILSLNGNIVLNMKVDAILKKNNKFEVFSDDNIDEYDIVISTLSTPNHKILYEFSDEYNNYLGNYKYQSAICALLVLDRKISEFYWTNVGDYNIPFGGVIEHTNFVGQDKYNGKSIVYLSKYLSNNSDFYSLSNDQILEEFYKGLSIIDKNFSKKIIVESYVFKQNDAQPIVLKGYKSPSSDTEIKDLYWISTHHVYPHDRGIEYGIEQANLLFERIVNEN
jgi:protoporphyrinogen oxidase